MASLGEIIFKLKEFMIYGINKKKNNNNTLFTNTSENYNYWFSLYQNLI